jgi:NAD(P)-dependent dehydrogenase (short-subunit alcohol dehydrogenase family)
MLLKDKVVIISGIGPGLGVKLAIEAAREGAKALAIGARSADKLDDAEKRIAAVNPDCKVLKQVTDSTRTADCEAMAAAATQAFGRIDALVNSAFFHGNMDYVSSAKLDEWYEVINTNLIGTLRLTQAVLPQMKKQGGGAIVMINTMAARIVPPLGEAGYAASKAALANSVKYSIHMGWMWGAPVQGYFEWQAQEQKVTVDSLKEGVARSIPLNRIPTDDECARAALFLVSDYASAVTGAALDANGGAYMP